MLAQIFNRNFENVFLCVLTLLLFTMPGLLERKLDITLPNTLQIIILLFIYAAEILGEIGAYYVTFPYWDTVLHTLNGFLCAAIGFSLLDILNRHNEARFHCFPNILAITRSVLLLDDGGRYLGNFFLRCTMESAVQRYARRTRSSARSAPCWTHRRQHPVVLRITDVIIV